MQRRCDVVQRGFSGYNSTWCRQLLPYYYPDNESVKNVAVFVIFLGVNDSCRPNTTGQDVSVELFQENLEAMVEYLVGCCSLPRESILLLTLPPVHRDDFEAHCKKKNIPCGKYQQDCGAFAKATNLASEKCQVGCVDVQKTFLQQENWRKLFCDGLHFSKLGSELLADVVWPEIEKRLAGGYRFSSLNVLYQDKETFDVFSMINCFAVHDQLFPLWRDLACASDSAQVLADWLKNYNKNSC